MRKQPSGVRSQAAAASGQRPVVRGEASSLDEQRASLSFRLLAFLSAMEWPCVCSSDFGSRMFSSPLRTHSGQFFRNPYPQPSFDSFVLFGHAHSAFRIPQPLPPTPLSMPFIALHRPSKPFTPPSPPMTESSWQDHSPLHSTFAFVLFGHLHRAPAHDRIIGSESFCSAPASKNAKPVQFRSVLVQFPGLPPRPFISGRFCCL